MRSIITALTIIGMMVFLTGTGIGADEADWFGQGLKLISQQRYDEAVKAFSTAIEIIPRDYQAYNYRGVARALQGDFDGAIADYDQALKIRPRYAEAYNNRGFARTQNGDLSGALNDHSRALEINPFFVDAYNNKAWIMATTDDKRFRNGAGAVMLAQKAVELSPDVASLDTLAAAYAAAGNFEVAVDTQKKAIQKLLLANQTSEVPKYMAHLNAYRSEHSLQINYSAALNTAKTHKSKTALKAKTKMAPPPPPSQTGKPAVPSKTGKAVAAAKAKKPIASTTVSTPLPYTIQISAFRDLQRSNRAARTLLTKGDRAFTCPVQISGKGKWYRVFIGYYKTYAEAKTAADELQRRKFRYVHISKKPYAVQVGLVSSPKEVQQLQSRLQAKGYLAYSLPAGSGQSQIRILIGAYESKEAAASLTRQLKEDGFSPKISLR